MALHNLAAHFCLENDSASHTGNFATIQHFKENKIDLKDDWNLTENVNRSVAHQTINEWWNKEKGIDTIRQALKSKIDSSKILKEINQNYVIL